MLRELDRNQLHTVDPKVLQAPSRIRLSRRKLAEQAQLEQPVALINFRQLQRRLYDLLAVDFADMAEFEEGRVLTPAEMEDCFYQHLGLLDEPTRSMLRPLLLSWQEYPGTRLSARIVDVLRFRRTQLRRGMETPLQDLLDWLLLSARLHEPLSVGGVRAFISKLGSRHREAAMRLLEDDYGTAEEVDQMPMDVPRFYLRLRDGVVPSLNATSCVTGRYYTIALDDLIAMDDTAFPNNPFANSTTPDAQLNRSAMCETMWQLAMHRRFRVKMDTYFLATTLLDRYLAVKGFDQSKLYLFGLASLIAAAKYEEIYTINLPLLCDMHHKKYTVAVLKEAEAHLLAALNVHLGCAMASTIASTMIVEQDPPASAAQLDLLQYILVTLSVRTFYGQYPQTVLAAAAVLVTRVAFGVPTGEPDEAVRQALPVVLDAVESNRTSQHVGRSLYSTFAHPSFHQVSLIPLLQLFEQ